MEFLDILDKFGRKTGETKERNQIHIDGDWHSSAHIWFLDSNNNILLQKRSSQKKLYPNTWCAPVSGHISAGKNAIETAITECVEEINVKITEDDIFLQAIIRGTFDEVSMGLKEREYVNVFISNKEILSITNIHNDEVDELRWFTFDEFRKLVETKDKSLVPAFEEYEIIISYIKHNR